MNRKLSLFTASVITLLLVALVAGAGAAVIVYQNDFDRANDVRKLVPRGNGCSRTFLDGVEKYGLEIKKGPRACKLKLPVYGERPQPDYEVSADFKTQRDTPKGVKKHLFFGILMRVDKDSEYQVRIYPHLEELRISRDPSGKDFPVKKTVEPITRIGFRNALNVRVEGGRIKVRVNGKRAANIDDPRPKEVEGTGIQLIGGIDGKAGRGARVSIDDIKVAVPRI